MSGVWKQSHGRTSEAPPNERGGNRYVRPTATAPHLDSTHSEQKAAPLPLKPTFSAQGAQGAQGGPKHLAQKTPVSADDVARAPEKVCPPEHPEHPEHPRIPAVMGLG